MNRRDFLKNSALATLSPAFSKVNGLFVPKKNDISIEIWTPQTIPGSYVPTFSGIAGNFQIAFMEVMHNDILAERNSTKVNKRKYPLVIFLHGIGERSGTTTADRGDPGQLSDLFTTLPMSNLRYDTSPYNTMNWRNPDGSIERVLWWAPQCWGGHSYFYPNYGIALLQWAHDNYHDIIDFNRVYLTGLSFGGGGCWVWLQTPDIAKQICAAAFNVPGYTTYGLGQSWQFPYNDNWQEIINNRIPVWTNHAINDDQTTGQPGNSANKAWWSDDGVLSLNQLAPNAEVRYNRFGNIATQPHASVWNRMYGTSNWNTLFTLENGSTTYYGEPNGINVINWFLQFNRLPRA